VVVVAQGLQAGHVEPVDFVDDYHFGVGATGKCEVGETTVGVEHFFDRPACLLCRSLTVG
jgi:hypothetical protein